MPSGERVPAAVVRAFVVLGWGVVALLAALVVVRAMGWDDRPLLIGLAAVSPLLFLLPYPVLLVAAVGARRWLAGSAIAGIVLHLLWFGALLPFVHSDRSLPAGAVRVRVLSANLLYSNPRAAELASTVERTSPDLVALQEYTNRNGSRLAATSALAAYPYRLLDPDGTANGIALFSRFPFRDAQKVSIAGRKALRAVATTPVGPVTVVVVHTVAPVEGSAPDWEDELRAIADLTHGVDGPLILTGDFNATAGNRQLAHVADRARVRDVLNATGDGYAMTWPADHRVPPYIRPDHVFAGRGAVPLDGHAVTVPGSDHRGIVADIGLGPA